MILTRHGQMQGLGNTARSLANAMAHRRQTQTLPCTPTGTDASNSGANDNCEHQHGDPIPVAHAMAHWFDSPHSGHEPELGATGMISAATSPQCSRTACTRAQRKRGSWQVWQQDDADGRQARPRNWGTALEAPHLRTARRTCTRKNRCVPRPTRAGDRGCSTRSSDEVGASLPLFVLSTAQDA